MKQALSAWTAQEEQCDCRTLAALAEVNDGHFVLSSSCANLGRWSERPEIRAGTSLMMVPATAKEPERIKRTGG